MHVYVLYQFWWLIFPAFFLVTGVVKMVLRNDYRRRKLREYGARPYPMPYTREGALGFELEKFQSWVVQRVDLHTSWEDYFGRAGGEVRKLGDRRVSLPLFGGAH